MKKIKGFNITPVEHLRRYYSKHWAILYFSLKRPPTVGDTITIGNLTATFKKNNKNPNLIK